MEIREAENADLEQLIELYMQLNDNEMAVFDDRLWAIWREILADKNHHIIVGEIDGDVISSCVIVIVPNLTHYQRPYALIENVVTLEGYRGKGFATQILHHAKEIARRENCYKIMLMTGSKQKSTLRFYERAGYNRTDKTAFIQWLN